MNKKFLKYLVLAAVPFFLLGSYIYRAGRLRSTKYLLLAAVPCIVIAVFVYKVSNSRTFQFFGEIVSEVRTDKKIVALTFDDGPTFRADSVLHILKRHNVKATFFLTGREMMRRPDIVRAILDKGHSIGNHSYSHRQLMFTSHDTIRREVLRTDSVITALGFRKKIYFRPPYCKKWLYLPWHLSHTNRTTVTWNIEPDSKAESDQSPEKIFENVKANIKPGSIILLHVMYSGREASVAALPRIIEWLQENEYHFVTVNEMLDADA